MAGDRTLKITILGDDRSGSAALKGVGDSADQAGSKVDKFGEKWGPRLAVAGAGAVALGAKLTQMGDESKQATAQLTQSIENAGGSMDDFAPRINRVSERLIDLGFDDEAAARAMATLTTASQDAGQAIDSMGLVADIAAARHISLESAADKLAKAQTGNTKIFKEFGIVLGANATEAERAAAMTELQARVSGQAAAQADNLSTKLTALRTRAENVAEGVGSVLGPALTIGGTAMAGLGGLTTATDMSLGQLAAKVGPLAATLGLVAGAVVVVTHALGQMNKEVSLSTGQVSQLARSTDEELVRTFEEARVKLGDFGLSTEQMFRDLAETSYGTAQRVISGLDAQTNKTREQQEVLEVYKRILGETGEANLRASADAQVHAQSAEQLAASLEVNTAQLRSVAASAGMTEAQIEELVASYRRLANQPDITKYIDIVTTYTQIGSAAGSAIKQKFARGLEMGPVKGSPGSAVPIFAHAGEWVVTPEQMENLSRSGGASTPIGGGTGGGDGPTINIYVDVGTLVGSGGMRELAEKLRDEFIPMSQRRGPLGF